MSLKRLLRKVQEPYLEENTEGTATYAYLFPLNPAERQITNYKTLLDQEFVEVINFFGVKRLSCSHDLEDLAATSLFSSKVQIFRLETYIFHRAM